MAQGAASNSMSQPVYMTDDQGNSIGGSGTSGSAMRVAGTTVTSDPTYTNGQTADFRISTKGGLYTTSVIAATLTDAQSNSGALFADPSNLGRLTAVGGYLFNGTSWDRARGDTVSAFSRPPPRTKTDGAATTATTTSQQLFAANTARSRVIIQNQDAAINVFVNIGAVAVAGANNFRIAPGASLELTGTSGTINIIAASGTPAISAWEF